MELQKLFVTLALKADEFKQGLGDAGKQAESFRSRIGGAFSQVGAVGRAAFLGVGAAAVAGFGMAMMSAIGMNASLEQSTMQFTTLMGDADMAAEHVAMLFELGAKTPFETEPIIQASKHLQVFGGAALNTRENLIMIGDAAAAVGAPFDEVAFWTGRMYSAIQGGQPFGEAAMRLQELGLLTPEVRAQMEGLQDAGADVNEVWGAMEGQFSNFEGAMEMQSQSWAGLTSTLMDQLSMAAAVGLKPFFALLQGGLSWLVNSGIIENVGNVVGNFFKLIATAPDEGGPLLDYLQELPTWLQPIGVFLAEAAIVFSAFFANLQEGMSPLNAFIEAIWDIAPQPVLDALVNFRDNILPGLVTAIHTIVDPIAAWAAGFFSVKDVLIALGILIASVVIPAIISMVVAMAPIILTIGAVIAVVALLRNAWQNNWGGIQEKTQAVIDFIVPLVKNAIQGIKDWWAANGEEIVAKAKADWEALKNAISTAIETVKTIISNAIANIKAWWEEHGAGIVATAEKAWGLIQGVIDGVTKQLNLIGEAFRLLFAGEWEKFGEKIFELWENAWNTVVEFLSGLWDMVLPWLRDLWARFTTWFTETDWGALGMSIINGIIQGLIDMAGALWDTITGIINGARDAAGEAAGEGSPAQEFVPLGIAIVEGIMQGIGEMEGDLYDKLGAIIQNATSVGNLASGFGNEFARQMIAPLDEDIRELNDGINSARAQRAGLERSMADVAARYGWDINDPGFQSFLMGIRDNYAPNSAVRNDIEWMLNMHQARLSASTDEMHMQQRLAEAEEKRLAMEEQMLAIQEKQQQLNFLQMQFDLIKLINDNGLDPSLLNGVQLGLGADPLQLMNIMGVVMGGLVEQASNELFSMTSAGTPAVNNTAPDPTDRYTTNIQTQNINGGQHIYINEPDRSELAELTELLR